MEVHPYEKVVAYKEGAPVTFAHFTVTLKSTEVKSFSVNGQNRQQTSEIFEIKLPNGNLIKRSVSQGFPGGVQPGFAFRTARDRFFEVEAFQGRMTAREVDTLTEPGAKPDEFISYVKANFNQDVLVQIGMTYLFPDFDLQVGAVKSQRKHRKLSPQEIEQWYLTVKSSIDSSSAYQKEARETALQSILKSRESLKKNPEIEIVTHTFEISLRTEKEVERQTFAAHENKTSTILLSGNQYLVEASPPADGLQNRHLTLRITPQKARPTEVK